MKSPHQRALDRFMVVAHRLHVPSTVPDALIVCLEAVEEARDALAIIEARPDAHQLTSLPALRSAIERVDAMVTE